MFKLITDEHNEKISKTFQSIVKDDYDQIVSALNQILTMIYKDIPEKKRIFYGRYSVLKKSGPHLYTLLNENNFNLEDLSKALYYNSDYEWMIRSMGVQLYTIHGEKTGDPTSALSLLEEAAKDESWELRECSSGFVRKLIKAYPETMNSWYLKMVQSEDPMQRRFASESIRPVADNGWFKKHPDFAFSIIEHLYHEKEEYPRTSIGNNLSDWMRINEEETFKIVQQLAANGDKNSYWIAYRACRNLVKTKPLLVMNTLKVDHYKYKKKKYNREDYI